MCKLSRLKVSAFLFLAFLVSRCFTDPTWFWPVKLFCPFLAVKIGDFVSDSVIYFAESHFGLLLEFLEICIHHLIYMHKIYPAGIFSRKQRYGISVQVSFFSITAFSSLCHFKAQIDFFLLHIVDVWPSGGQCIHQKMPEYSTQSPKYQWSRKIAACFYQTEPGAGQDDYFWYNLF